MLARRFAAIAGLVLLAIAPNAIAQNRFWDISTAAGLGGDGTWGNTFSTAATGDTALTTADNTHDIFFQGTSGTVTLNANQAGKTLTFATTGYKLTTNNTTTRTLTGPITLNSNVELILGAGSTSDRILALSGGVSGSAGSKITIDASATGSNHNRINIAGSSSTVSVAIEVSGSGFGALVGTGSGAIISSDITQTGDSSRFNIGATSGNSLEVSGKIDFGTNTIRIAAGSSGGAGVVLFSNSNNTWGTTELNNSGSGIVRMGIANALPTGTTLTFGTTSGNGQSNVELNGFNTTIGQLTNLVATGGVVRNTNDTSATLTISGSDNSAAAYSGTLQDGTGLGLFNLVRSGTGTTILSANNSTYTGTTTISGGVLSVNTLADGGSNSSIGASTNAASNLVINGGTLRFAGTTGSPQTTNRSFTLGTSGGTIEANGTSTIGFTATAITLSGSNTARTLTLGGTNTGTNALAAVIGNNGTGATSLTKAGAGKWELGGASTYTGNTNINNGTLALGASASIDNSANIVVATGGTFDVSLNASYSVKSGQTLGGTGTVAGAISVASGGTVRGGTGLSTGTINTAQVNIQQGGSIFANLAASGTSSTINVGSNQLNLNSNGTKPVIKLDDVAGFRRLA